jgi:glycosyl transferase family 87
VTGQAGTTAARPAGTASPLGHVLALLFLGLAPVLLVAAFTLGVVHDRYAFDFHTFWAAGRDVVHGRSPYPSPQLVAHARPAAGAYEYFVYPPPFVLALVPLAVLPWAVAAALWTFLLLAATAGALWLLGARDWRCYGVAFAAIPTLSSLRLGAVTPLLLLLVAVAWRYRDRWPVAGAAVGAAIAIKLFLWPLAGWLLLTRRWRAAAAATVGATAVTLAAWAAIGFHGLSSYVSLLRLPDPRLSWLALAVPLAAAALVTGLRAAPRDRDERLLAATVLASLLLTPVLWLHYFALLLVPVALRNRTFGSAWLLLLGYWASPLVEPEQHPLWRLAFVLALTAFLATAFPPTARARRSALGPDPAY